MQSKDTKFDKFFSRDLALMYYRSYRNWNSKQFWLEILTIKTCQTEAYASRESLLDFLRTSAHSQNLPKSGCVDRMEVFSSQTSIYIIIIEAKIDQISHHISLPISVIQRPIFLVMFPRNWGSAINRTSFWTIWMYICQRLP